MVSPLFTVIVPTYGRTNLLREAVASVLAQTVDDFECLVVDDASSEEPVLPRDPRLRVVRRAVNGGPAAARNAGLDQALGRYVAYLDDDDLYEPDRLAIALEGLAQAPVAICLDRTVDGASGDTLQLEGDVHDRILDATTPHVGRTSLRRDIVPYFNERFRAAEDSEWWLRLSATSSVTTVNKVGFRYRRLSGVRSSATLAERARGNLMLLDVHGGYFSTHPRAAAFRWKRVGVVASQAGDQALARVAFARSIRRHPNVATAWHLARTLRPSSASITKTLSVTAPQR